MQCLSQVRLNWEDCRRKGIWRKNGGMMEVGRWLVRMELHPSGLSGICSVIFPCTKKSRRRFLLALAPWVCPEKKGRKMVVCVYIVYAFILLDLVHYGNIPLGPCVLIVKLQCCFTTTINFYWRLSYVHLNISNNWLWRTQNCPVRERETTRWSDLRGARQTSEKQDTADNQSGQPLPATNDVKLIHKSRHNTLHSNKLHTHTDTHRHHWPLCCTLDAYYFTR